MSTPIARRTFISLAGAAAGGAVSVGVSGLPAFAEGGHAATPKRQFRAMWIASVVNIDWPSTTGLSVAEQKEEFLGWLDLAQELNLNAVICQVRPTADAFWPSPYEPWSQYLTGTQGVDPGYDPLEFGVAEAHKRNLEYHAWFNPYRVSMQNDPSALIPDHPARAHPDWIFAYGPKLYYNPGIPQVRTFVEDAMLDAVRRYDIDAVHFDDYFYPYPIAGTELPDADTFATYGGDFDSVEDWRRDNINTLVSEMHERIHDIKPWVKFGISPFGIWRNKASDPRGSETGGTESYDAISADTYTWVKQGWVDYINPQVYWNIGLAVADYAKLVPWWAGVVADTYVGLYIGQATYKMTSGVFTDPEELSNHLTFNADYPEVDGDVWFSAKDVRADAQGATSLMAAQHYSKPALVPVLEGMGGRAPQRPHIASSVRRTRHGRELKFGGSGGRSHPTSYAIWRFDHRERIDIDDASHLIATVRAEGRGQQRFTDTTADERSTYRYVVTAYDRLWHESPPSREVVSRGR